MREAHWYFTFLDPYGNPIEIAGERSKIER